MYKWFMAWRYLHTKLIAVFAVLAVALCVAMVLVVMSVMGGFLDMIKERSRGLLSDIVMDAGTLQGWPFYEEFAQRLHENLPDVVEASTPVIYNYAVFRVPEVSYTKPAQVVGIRLKEYIAVNDFGKGLYYERYYPGTTHLGPQKQPLAGLPPLPDELKGAIRTWLQEECAARRKTAETYEAPRRSAPDDLLETIRVWLEIEWSMLGKLAEDDESPDITLPVELQDVIKQWLRAECSAADATKEDDQEQTLTLPDGLQALLRTWLPGRRITLPDDLRNANIRWRNDDNTTPEDIAAYDRLPFVLGWGPGDRVFDFTYDQPGYDGLEFPGVIVGCDLIYQRGRDGTYKRSYPRGTMMALTLVPLTASGNINVEGPVRVPVRYADDSRTGVYDKDSLCVYVDFEMLQHKLAMDPQELVDGRKTKPRTTQLLVDLQNGIDLLAGREAIETEWDQFLASQPSEVTDVEERLLSYVEVNTWEDLQRPFIAAVEKEKVLMAIILAIICFVAVMLIGCIFYMIVQKKTRDIGVLKALGATGPGVAGLFIIYGASVGVVGSVLGNSFGALFVHYINDFQDFLISLDPQLQVWNPEVYTFDRIPSAVKRLDVLGISLVAVLSSILGSLIPAVLAGRVWPVQALRYE
ncbi:MAG: FtsX-like permease family protein [Phycisphaerales bacterium]|nr:MAG: FtsX-like permease family protein [Phycisphaerales bacterium]